MRRNSPARLATSRSMSWNVPPSPAAQCSRPAAVAKAGPDARFRQAAHRRAAGPAAPARPSMRAAISRTPASWQAPPVSTTRLPAARARPELPAGPCTHTFEGFFDARADDVHHHAARHFRDLMVLLADQRHRQHARARRPGWTSTLPYSVFSRSACASGVDRPIARSLGDVQAADAEVARCASTDCRRTPPCWWCRRPCR